MPVGLRVMVTPAGLMLTAVLVPLALAATAATADATFDDLVEDARQPDVQTALIDRYSNG